MAETTEISWADATFNPWEGCAKVSAGCKNCYAEKMAKRFGKDFAGTRTITSDRYWKEPLKWNRKAAESGTRLRVFCASVADVFENWHGPITTGRLGEILCKPYLDSESGPENWIECWPEDHETDPQGWRPVPVSVETHRSDCRFGEPHAPYPDPPPAPSRFLEPPVRFLEPPTHVHPIHRVNR